MTYTLTKVNFFCEPTTIFKATTIFITTSLHILHTWILQPPVQSRFAETRFAETRFAETPTLTLTLTLNPKP